MCSTDGAVWPPLEALLVEIDRATPGAIRSDAPASGSLVLVPSAPAPGASAALPIAIAVDDAGPSITIAGWTERFAIDPEDPEDDADQRALDLVAAALFGRLTVRVERVGDHPTLREFIFATTRGPLVHRTERAFRWPWQRATRAVLANAVPVPPSLVLGETGRVPRTPWSGLLGAVHAAAPAAIAIDGELDLHPFSPREVKPLVLEYIEVCKQRGITELRIVHGKGIGALRRTVHALLAKHPDVASYRLGGMGEGSWGATLVTLNVYRDP